MIKVMEDALVLYRHKPGSLTLRHWQYLHDRTGGSIVGLAELIREAVILACDTGGEEVTRKLMDEIVINEDATDRYQTVLKRRAKAAASGGHSKPAGSVAG